jgi:hypothetical protein
VTTLLGLFLFSICHSLFSISLDSIFVRLVTFVTVVLLSFLTIDTKIV